MTFHRLYIFCKVVEYQSFSIAATNLFTTQPSITKIIQSFEEELGVALFARHRQRSKGIALTEAGKKVYITAKEILAQWDQLESDLVILKPNKNFKQQQQQQQQSITIITGCSIGMYLLPQLLNKFRLGLSKNILPQVCIATNFHEIIEAVKHELYDIVIFPDFPETNVIRLPAHFVYKERLVAVGNGKFYQANSIYDLEDLQLVLPPKTSINRKLLDHYFDINKIKPNIALEMSHPESVKKLILPGKMVSIFPIYAAVEELEKGILTPLSLKRPLPDVTYKVSLLKNQPMVNEVFELLSFLDKQLNQYWNLVDKQ